MKPSDLAKPSDCLCHIEPGDLSPLPPPYEDFNEVTIPSLKPEKVKNIESTDAFVVVTECPSCLMQLAKGEQQSGHFKVMHISQVLADG